MGLNVFQYETHSQPTVAYQRFFFTEQNAEHDAWSNSQLLNFQYVCSLMSFRTVKLMVEL